jgi:hypothetical protein
VLSKATTIAAGLFMITSLSLSILATRSGGAVPAIFEKKAPAQKNSGQQPPPVGTQVPLQVTPSVNGQQTGPTQTIPVPVQDQPVLPGQKPPAGQKK